jgi:hypothetical protein
MEFENLYLSKSIQDARDDIDDIDEELFEKIKIAHFLKNKKEIYDKLYTYINKSKAKYPEQYLGLLVFYVKKYDDVDATVNPPIPK